MFERMQGLPEGIVGLQATGKVTEKDYADVVHPLLESARAEGRRLRFLVEFGTGFEGFTAGAAWADARLGLHYLRLFERCAIVTDVHWMRDAVHVVGTMMPCPVRVFGSSEHDTAVKWLSEPLESHIKHRFLTDKGVLVLEPHGRLQASDFDTLGAIVDPWIESHGDLRGLVLHVQKIPGWENLGGLMRHLRFVREHHKKVHRVALVADGTMSDLAAKGAEHFIAAEMQHFPYDQLNQAIDWAGV